jgi:hypothetical protein
LTYSCAFTGQNTTSYVREIHKPKFNLPKLWDLKINLPKLKFNLSTLSKSRFNLSKLSKTWLNLPKFCKSKTIAEPT